ncbi:MAG: helix-turn-helix domain-containing protein [Phycisphaerales bacterium]|nr:helix-turn-helix domain-containing protein [Phycisphaerales bacterium]
MTPAVIDRTVEIKYDGAMHTVAVAGIPVEQCGACGEFTYGADSEAVIHAALRKQLGLLTPEEIRACRVELGLTQSQLAASMGMAPESISRWESGTVMHSRATDRHLRGYFGVPRLRELYEQLDRGACEVLVVKGTPPVVASEPSHVYGILSLATPTSKVWPRQAVPLITLDVGQKSVQGSPYSRDIPPYEKKLVA